MKKNSNYILVAGLGLLVVVALLTRTLSPPETPNAQLPGGFTQPHTLEVTAPSNPSAPLFQPAPESLVPIAPAPAVSDSTLADIDTPQSLNVDEQGQLVVDEGVRELMDFFLARDGEFDAAQIRNLFLAAALAQCSEPCAQQALAIYDRYVDYVQQMQTEMPAIQANGNLRERLQQVTTLRAALLGDELATSLFAYDDAYDNLRVTQWEIRTNANLSEDEKMQALQELKFTQPADLTAREQQNEKLEAVRNLSRQFAAQNIDADARFAARSELLDAAAAERLRALDDSRAQWNQRYEMYRNELASLDTDGLAEADRQQAVLQLRARLFSEQEAARAAALDRINGSSL